jgi:hypothetical protein
MIEKQIRSADTTCRRKCLAFSRAFIVRAGQKGFLPFAARIVIETSSAWQARQEAQDLRIASGDRSAYNES